LSLSFSQIHIPSNSNTPLQNKTLPLHHFKSPCKNQQSCPTSTTQLSFPQPDLLTNTIHSSNQSQEVAEASDEEVYAQSEGEEDENAALVHQDQQQRQVQQQQQAAPAPQKQRQPRYQQPVSAVPQQQQQMQPRIAPRGEGYRPGAIRESRIKDRPVSKTGASDSALKIKIELDLEVEVDLYARVKGDVTIGLM
jgi:hypothetical protein